MGPDKGIVENIMKTWGGMPMENKGKHKKNYVLRNPSIMKKRKARRRVYLCMCLFHYPRVIYTQKNSSFKVPTPSPFNFKLSMADSQASLLLRKQLKGK